MMISRVQASIPKRTFVILRNSLALTHLKLCLIVSTIIVCILLLPKREARNWISEYLLRVCSMLVELITKIV